MARVSIGSCQSKSNLEPEKLEIRQLTTAPQIFQYFDLRPDNVPYELKVRALTFKSIDCSNLALNIPQFKSTLTIKPTGFQMHATLRKDMLINPASFGQTPGPTPTKMPKHQGKGQEAAADDVGRQKVYIYYGQPSVGLLGASDQS
jgi:hypothetical protein